MGTLPARSWELATVRLELSPTTTSLDNNHALISLTMAIPVVLQLLSPTGDRQDDNPRIGAMPKIALIKRKKWTFATILLATKEIGSS